MSEEKEVQKTVTLDEEGDVFLLNKPVPSYQGLDGDYRLLTAVYGSYQVVVYEAISGNDRYPPGRNMHITLSFQELEQLIKSYEEFKAAQKALEEKRKAEYAARYGRSGDDFDPFLDSDELP